MKPQKEIAIAFLFLVIFTLRVNFCFSQTTNVKTDDSQALAANWGAGSTNVLLYFFTMNVTSGSPAFTDIKGFTTSGTYIDQDLVNIKLWRSDFEFFGGGSLTTIATINTNLGPGTHTISFANPLPASGSKYFWITADLVSNAICGDNITLDLITSSMYIVTGTLNYGTNTAAGAQTVTGGGCQPMPVDLLSFTGKQVEGKNVLEWTTATETFNDYFTVERSFDGSVYSEVEKIKGAGNSQMLKNYSATDEIHHAGIIYYRLKQTDLNGDQKYFHAIQIEPGSGPPKVYPNPSAGTFYVQPNVLNETAARYTITDITGKVIFEKRNQVGATTLDLQVMPPGIYFLLIEQEEGRLSYRERIVKH